MNGYNFTERVRKVLAMARGDGAGVIGRIAGVASRRLEEIDPRGTMRFAATTGRQR